MSLDAPPVALPATKHSVFYSYAFLVGGKPIGSAESINIRGSRLAIERIREVYYSHGPITREIVWGGVDISIDVRRVELYATSLYAALGFDVTSLEQINGAIDLLEVRYQRTADGTETTREVSYYDCVPSTWGRDLDIGTARVIETVTLECTTMMVHGSS
jgi:hypothetical protein